MVQPSGHGVDYQVFYSFPIPMPEFGLAGSGRTGTISAGEQPNYFGTQYNNNSRSSSFEILGDDTGYTIMERIHDRFGINIVSNFLTRMTGKSIPTANANAFSTFPAITGPRFPSAISYTKTDDLLTFVASRIDSQVWADSGLRIIADRHWSGDRKLEIPEPLVDRWRRVKAECGGLRIQEATEMANLSAAQLDGLDLYGLNSGFDITMCQPMLKAIGSLNANQWKQAMTKSGLPLSELNEAQLARFVDWFKNSNNSIPDPMGCAARAVLVKPGEAQKAVLTISHDNPSGTPSGTTKPRNPDTDGSWNCTVMSPDIQQYAYQQQLKDWLLSHGVDPADHNTSSKRLAEEEKRFHNAVTRSQVILQIHPLTSGLSLHSWNGYRDPGDPVMFTRAGLNCVHGTNEGRIAQEEML
jgi:hypothetical protein